MTRTRNIRAATRFNFYNLKASVTKKWKEIGLLLHTLTLQIHQSVQRSTTLNLFSHARSQINAGMFVALLAICLKLALFEIPQV